MIKPATIVAAAVTGVVALATAPVAVEAMDMGGSADDGAHVSVLFGSLTPVKVDALAGEQVSWGNDSVRDHTITADDGSFDSGTLGPNTHFSRMFASDGTIAYHCRLHPYIRGEVAVHRLLLDRPSTDAAPGKPYPLSGRAALPLGATVKVEFDGGEGFHHVADATVGGDGHFNVQVTPSESGTYRAVSGDEQSPGVDLLVLNRTITASSRGRRVSATVTPAAPGATVVLQLYLKERFGWWPVAKRKLDMHSRATFNVRRGASARVVLTLPDGATQLATSKVLKRAAP